MAQPITRWERPSNSILRATNGENFCRLRKSFGGSNRKFSLVLTFGCGQCEARLRWVLRGSQISFLKLVWRAFPMTGPSRLAKFMLRPHGAQKPLKTPRTQSTQRCSGNLTRRQAFPPNPSDAERGRGHRARCHSVSGCCGTDLGVQSSKLKGNSVIRNNRDMYPHRSVLCSLCSPLRPMNPRFAWPDTWRHPDSPRPLRPLRFD